MTTIAVTDTDIAADGMSFLGEVRHRSDCKKLLVLNGAIYALAGAGALREPLIKWHQDGADPKKIPECKDNGGWTLLVVKLDGLTIFSSDVPFPTKVIPPFAMGSGESFAYGAMEVGANAVDAVRAAAARDPYTGGEINYLIISETLTAPLMQAAE